MSEALGNNTLRRIIIFITKPDEILLTVFCNWKESSWGLFYFGEKPLTSDISLILTDSLKFEFCFSGGTLGPYLAIDDHFSSSLSPI